MVPDPESADSTSKRSVGLGHAPRVEAVQPKPPEPLFGWLKRQISVFDVTHKVIKGARTPTHAPSLVSLFDYMHSRFQSALDLHSIMSSPKMQEKLNLEKELCDPPPLNNISLPTASQLLDACTTVEARGHTTWPLEGPPVFWIKYGRAVYWNEVLAQNMAHRELWSLESPVRAPAVFYAFKYQSRVFLVMGHIAGDTASKRLEEAGSQEETDRIVDLVALSLSELYRIPIAPGSRPAAVDGGRIRHTFFEDQDAPMHYGNVSQLEEHIDKVMFLKLHR